LSEELLMRLEEVKGSDDMKAFSNETTTLIVDPEGALPKVLERVKNGVRTRSHAVVAKRGGGYITLESL
jgi:hypothetical protein